MLVLHVSAARFAQLRSRLAATPHAAPIVHSQRKTDNVPLRTVELVLRPSVIVHGCISRASKRERVILSGRRSHSRLFGVRCKTRATWN